MKAIVSSAVLVLAVGWSSSAYCQVEESKSQQDNMLAEMKKCAVCKYMVANPELMKNMTWETHKIDNGMLCLTTVPKEMKKEFDAVSEKMMQAIDEVKSDAEQGEEVVLCSFCASMGELMKSNAKQQHIETATGAIHLCTSDDPAVVKKIHAMADKAIAEQKKMQAQQERTAALQ